MTPQSNRSCVPQEEGLRNGRTRWLARVTLPGANLPRCRWMPRSMSGSCYRTSAEETHPMSMGEVVDVHTGREVIELWPG